MDNSEGTTPLNDLAVSVDLGKCIASANCVSVAPTAFRVNMALDEVELLDTGSVDRQTLIAAAMACPTKAIYLDDANGRPLWPPAGKTIDEL